MGPAAVIFAATSKCKVCSPNLPPHASHNGCLPFLISKESIDSLINNQQDHGLDYHLRIAFRVEHQVAHFVGSVLEDIGLAQITLQKNQRTGRAVRTLTLLKTPEWVIELERKLFSELEAHTILHRAV